MEQVAAQLDKLLELFPIVPTSALPAQVTPTLYLGSAEHAKNVALLCRMKISVVINCAEGEVTTEHYAQLQQAGISVIGFQSKDTADYPLLEKHLDDVLALVREVRGHGDRALIHCQAGVNRSGALAIACLIDESGMPLLEAAAKVKAARGRVCTNRAFQKQLLMEAVKRGWKLS